MLFNIGYKRRVNEPIHPIFIAFSAQLTDIEEQLETDSIPIKEEEEDLPEAAESEQGSEKDEKPTMPFGDFLDLMEVF